MRRYQVNIKFSASRIIPFLFVDERLFVELVNVVRIINKLDVHV